MTYVELLRQRVAGMPESREAIGDVAFALGNLREAAASDGRMEMLQDLQHRAEAVQDSHDPVIVSKLTNALEAFLNDEMNTAIGAEEEQEMGPEATDATTTGAPPTEALPEAAAATCETCGQSLPEDQTGSEMEASTTCQACGQMLPEPEEEAPAVKPAAAPFEKVTEACEACGKPLDEPSETKEWGMKESGRETTQGAKEAGQQGTAQVADDGGIGRLVETEREELIRLRAQDRTLQRRTRAEAAITEADATGLVTVEELTAFQESQWPILLNRWVGSERSYNGGERDMPAHQIRESGRAAAKSPADIFKESLGQ